MTRVTIALYIEVKSAEVKVTILHRTARNSS